MIHLNNPINQSLFLQGLAASDHPNFLDWVIEKYAN